MANADTVIVCSLPLAKNAMHSPTSILTSLPLVFTNLCLVLASVPVAPIGDHLFRAGSILLHAYISCYTKRHVYISLKHFVAASLASLTRLAGLSRGYCRVKVGKQVPALDYSRRDSKLRRSPRCSVSVRAEKNQ